MRRNDALQLALQLSFWIVMTICNSYFYVMSVIRQLAWVAIHSIYGVIYCNSIAILLKQLIFNQYAIPIQ
jgi:hypothetical protein